MIAATYLIVRVLLALLHGVIKWRTANAQAWHVVVSASCDEAEKLAGTHPKTEETARGRLKRESAVRKLAEEADRIEDVYLARQKFSDRLGGVRVWLKEYKGRAVPYVTSAVEVITIVSVGEYHGWTLAGGVEAVRTFTGI